MEQQKGFYYSLLKKRYLVILLAVIIFIAGLASYTTLPKQQYPIVLTPVVTITAVYPGASPDEMEELVTKKIEYLAMEAKGFDFCYSQSLDSACVVVVRFGLSMSGNELELSQNDLRNKVSDLWANELPDGVTSVQFGVAEINTAGLILAFTGEEQSNAELAQRAEELKSILQKLDGVQRVKVDGRAEERIMITVDMAQLNQLNLSLNELTAMIGYKNSIIPVGNIAFETDKITVNTSGMFANMQEIQEIIVDVSPTSGAVTQLKDIASIDLVTDEDAKRYQYNGQDTILLNLYYEEGINIVAAGKEVRAAAVEYQSRMPEGIALTTVIDLADEVDGSVNDFVISVLQALLIVLVVVMVGMSLRNGGIVAVAIPVSLAVPFLVMKFFGIDVQFISLASLIIALGMLVDNAVVVSDAIQVRIDAGEERAAACVGGVKSVAFPVLASTLTTVSIFVMFYMLPGIMQSFVFSLPTIVISALLASYAVSIFVTPVMCYFLMQKSDPTKVGFMTKLLAALKRRMFKKQSPATNAANKKHRSLLDLVRNVISRLLNYGFDHKTRTVFIAIVLLVGSVSRLSFLTVQFMPQSEKEIIDISISTTNLNDIRHTYDAVGLVVDIVTEQPETTYYLSAVGGGVPQYDFAATTTGDMINNGNVILGIDLSAGGRFKSKTAFLEYLQNEMDHRVPGCRVVVTELQIVPADGSPIQVKVLGSDFATLNEAAAVIEEELARIEGTMNVYSDRQFEYQHYYVDMNNNILNAYGLTKAEVQSELNVALMGRQATVYRYHNSEHPIIVKSDINSSEDLGNLMIKGSATGAKYQLKQLANIGLNAYHGAITRYNGDRAITVSASPRIGYSAMTLQSQLQEALEMKDLGNVTLQYEGESKNMAEAQESMQVGVAIGVIGILLVLYIQFNSLRQVLIVFSAVPFCFIGASLGLFIFRPGFNLFTILGMLSLVGVVVNNAIVLVDFINKERENGVPIEIACKSAVDRRFRPVFLSTMTAVLGMLPLAMGGNVLFKGMAVAFMCGDALSMFFTLIIVPIVYGAWEGAVERKRQKKLVLEG